MGRWVMGGAGNVNDGYAGDGDNDEEWVTGWDGLV